MKNLLRFLCVPLLSAIVLSCGESHFLKEKSYRDQVINDFEQKRRALPHGDLFAVFSDDELTSFEREALMFLYAYMPIGDVTDYPGEYYLENVRLSEQARAEMPWGKSVPDDLFRHFVLPVRVNNENLDDSRKVFYQELKDRVKGLSMEDAILEVNHWCHEKVVYQPSDARTSSPLATVKTAYGRCGEESTFTVAALRAVGIPARQVYTPRWAHTDDNHAWVEAWANGKWYFFGACEPEPVLNLGWFNAPASRGMLMHTEVFGRYNGPEEIMSEVSSFTEINVTSNYAATAKATVTVVDDKGNPVSGAKVEYKIYNYGEFYTAAAKYTDADGKASLTAGMGDMLVWASSDDGHFGFAKLSFGKQAELTLPLDKKEGDLFAFDFDIVPPAERANLPEVTPEQRAENDRRMAREDSIRNAYVATMMNEERAKKAIEPFRLPRSCSERMVKILVASRGNHQTLIDFLKFAAEKKGEEFAVGLLGELSAKDWRDVTLDVLKDHFLNAPDVREVGLQASVRIANPRVSNEMLTPYRGFLRGAVAQADAEAFVKDPSRLVEWCKKEIRIDNSLNMKRIPMSPIGVWKARVADEKSRDVFFVALARTLGIQAWIDEVTGKVQYADADYLVKDGKAAILNEGRTVDVNFEEISSEQAPTGMIRVTYQPIPSLDDPKYYSHFTLSKYMGGDFKLLSYDEGDTDMGGGVVWSNLMKNGLTLDTGYYMLTSGTRMASGAVLARVCSFNVEAGASTGLGLVMRRSDDQVQVIGSFNSESLFHPLDASSAEDLRSVLQACGRGYFIVGVLGVGQEPTNHALKDIAALSGEFEKWGRKMVLLFPSEEQYKKYRPEDFPGLPSTIVYGIDADNRIQKQIAETMKLSNASSLPIFIIADTFNRVVFVSQGYTIGLGEQLMRVIHGL